MEPKLEYPSIHVLETPSLEFLVEGPGGNGVLQQLKNAFFLSDLKIYGYSRPGRELAWLMSALLESIEVGLI